MDPYEDVFAILRSEPVFELVGMPSPPHGQAFRDDLLGENRELRNVLDEACFQMQRDYALKRLMDHENERLRKRLFEKPNKPNKKLTSGFARHMTSEENLLALAREVWQLKMKEVFRSEKFKARKDLYDDHVRQEANAEKEREKNEKSRERRRRKRRSVGSKNWRRRKSVNERPWKRRRRHGGGGEGGGEGGEGSSKS